MGNAEDTSNTPVNNNELVVKKSGASKNLEDTSTANNSTSVIVSIGNHQKIDSSTPPKVGGIQKCIKYKLFAILYSLFLLFFGRHLYLVYQELHRSDLF